MNGDLFVISENFRVTIMNQAIMHNVNFRSLLFGKFTRKFKYVCNQRQQYSASQPQAMPLHEEEVMNKKLRNPDGTIKLRNPNIAKMKSDYLYHLALGTGQDLKKMFGDVRFVITGGTKERMRALCYYLAKVLKITIPTGFKLNDISKPGHRYAMYKIGPILAASHGMGIPSIGILLHELIKLMYHSKAKDPVFFRMGTCGGIGLPPGSVVVSEACCNAHLEQHYTLPILGKVHKRPALLDKELAAELMTLSSPKDKFKLAKGVTMCTDDFYEGQGRLDGAFADHSEEDKLKFLNMIHSKGIINIEMESINFAAMTHHAGVKAGVLCVTLLNRLKGDQIDSPPSVLEEFQDRPMHVLGRYLQKHYKG